MDRGCLAKLFEDHDEHGHMGEGVLRRSYYGCFAESVCDYGHLLFFVAALVQAIHKQGNKQNPPVRWIAKRAKANTSFMAPTLFMAKVTPPLLLLLLLLLFAAPYNGICSSAPCSSIPARFLDKLDRTNQFNKKHRDMR